MADFDYGNARLRAMKAKLMSSQELDELAEANSLQGLIAALATTTYRKPLEAALARTSGMECLYEALHNDLIQTLGKILDFYQGKAAQSVNMVFGRYDVHNLKVILRGLAKHAPPGEIIAPLFPIGQLKEDVISDLISVPGARAAIDLLASMGLKIAHPLIQLRVESPGASLPEMELVLDRWYYEGTLRELKSSPSDAGVLLPAIKLEVDLVNLLTILRFIRSPDERKSLRQSFGADDLGLLLLGPGHLSFDMLGYAGMQDSLSAAVEVFSDTYYAQPLILGLEAYERSVRLSDFEKHLKRYRLGWMSMLIVKDPLGIGVLLGVLALKINEVSNLRWIAKGVEIGIQADKIRAELEYPP